MCGLSPLALSHIYRPGTLLEKLQNRYYILSLRIIEVLLLLTILERSCCTYLFFSHLLKPLQKLDRILQKISIPPEIFKQFSYPPFFCSENLRSPPKILCPPPVGYIMNAALAPLFFLASNLSFITIFL